MKKFLVGLTFVAMAATAFAIPTEKEVEAAANSGNYAQAESLMKEVVDARPNSAKAHYLYAEFLAHNGKFSLASDEAKSARRIDPAISFTDSAKFASFEQLLQREQATGSRASTTARAPAAQSESGGMSSAMGSAGTGIPNWVWLVGVLGVGVFLWRGFAKSRAAGAAASAGYPGAAMAGSPYGVQPGGPGNAAYNMNPQAGQPGYPQGNPAMNPQAPYGMNPGMNPGMQQPARGGGMLGTGLAVGGGLAGGMLLNEFLHRREDGQGGEHAGNLAGAAAADPNHNFAGLQPGFDQAGNELESRQIDYGNGNDWDDGSSASSDGGGGGGDDWT